MRPVGCASSRDFAASVSQQRRFSHSGGPDQRDGLPQTAPWRQNRRRVRCFRIQRDHGQPALQRRRLLLIPCRIRDLIDLRQHDHRVRPGLVCERQIALKPGGIEIVVARGHDEKRVDVCCDKLLGAGALGPALQQGLTLQTTPEHVRLGVGQNPIPYGKIRCIGVDGQVDPHWTGLRFSGQSRPVHRRDAQAGKAGFVGLQLVAKERGPTESGQ